MNHLKAGLAGCGLAILTACTGPTVHFDYDVNGAFAQYKTYDWYAAPKEAQAKANGMANPLMDARVHRVVDATLAAKGFRKETAKDPDFLVLVYPSYQPYRTSRSHVGVGMGFGLFLMIYRVLHPEGTAQGVFTLFAVLFFFIGAQFLAFGLLGEYIGRIYQEVRDRPRYVVKKVHKAQE